MKQSLGLFLIACAVPSIAAAQSFGLEKSPTVADVAGACGGQLQHDDFMKLSPARKRSKLSCYVREISRKINRKLPTRTDFTTLVERTTVAGVTMTYHFRADIEVTEIQPGAMEAWKPTVQAKICADPGMREIVSLGGNYRYVWRDREGRYIDTLIVRGCWA